MKYIEVPASVEGLDPAVKFIHEILNDKREGNNSSMETVLVFEELFTDIIENGVFEEETIRISYKSTFGNRRFYISFYGERFSIDCDSGDNLDPHVAILRSYEDRYSFNYRRRNNTITLECKGNHQLWGKAAIVMVAVLAIYFILLELVSPEQVVVVRNSFIKPVINAYVTAVIMISAPVTFFSLVKNISDVSVTMDRRHNIKKILLSVSSISICAIGVAIGIFYLIRPMLRAVFTKYTFTYHIGTVENLPALSELLENIVPTDIIQAFTLTNPVPLIFLAILTAASICSMDRNFSVIKSINDALYTLSCKMLSIIMWFMPFVAVLAALSMLISAGTPLVLLFLIYIVIATISIAVLSGIRLISLKSRGIRLLPFIKVCLPLIVENFSINSSIDAVPYNTRFCNSVLKINKSFLEVELPVLAQISLCGNCVIITLYSLISSLYFGIDLSIGQILVISFLVLAMSVGAPNQPGSVFIGMAIIFSYFQIPVAGMAIIVIAEVLLGRFATLLNTLSDIITVYSHELDRKKKADICHSADAFSKKTE